MIPIYGRPIQVSEILLFTQTYVDISNNVNPRINKPWFMKIVGVPSKYSQYDS